MERAPIKGDGWGSLTATAVACVTTAALWAVGNILFNRIALEYLNLHLGNQAEVWMSRLLSILVDPRTAAGMTETIWWGIALTPSALQQYARKRWKVEWSIVTSTWSYIAGATVIHLIDVLLPALGVVVMFDLWHYLDNVIVLAGLLVFGILVSLWAQNTMLDTAGEAWGMLCRLLFGLPRHLSRNAKAARHHNYRHARRTNNATYDFTPSTDGNPDEMEGAA